MLKVRITFIDDEKGNGELEQFIEDLEKDTAIISKSRIYKGRGESIYSNIYLDVEKGR